MRPELQQRLRSQRNFPTPPKVAQRVLELARAPETDLEAVADAVTKDPGLSAKLMRTANSALHYSPRRRSNNVHQALVTLGLNAAITLALGFSITAAFQRGQGSRLDYPRFWRRTLLMAMASRAIGEALHVKSAEDFFLAGLLQDIGVLAIDRIEPALYGELLADSPVPVVLAHERARLGDDHSVVGAWLLRSWNLPEDLCEAVARSHAAEHAPADTHPGLLCRAVSLSNDVADVFVDIDRRTAIAQVAERGHALLGLSALQAMDVIGAIATLLPEVETIFEANIIDAETAVAITLEAQELLADRSLESVQQLAELQHTADSLSAATEALQDAARRDALTGVMNRGYLDDRLLVEFGAAEQKGRPLAVLFVDLDHFKQVNDTYGHAAGDVVLRSTARILREQLRDADTLARFGGEEFVVLLPGVDCEGGRIVAERIVGALRRAAHETPDGSLSVTASLGLAVHSPANRYGAAASLLAAADAATYAAKRAGRDRVAMAPGRESAARGERLVDHRPHRTQCL